MEKLKVMVVDDSAFMRKIIGDMISTHSNLELISTARDGVDVLNKLKSIHPDVITLDVEMPNMDGLETLKEIKKTKDIPVIMLSSLTAKNSKVTMEALTKGAYDFIEKPSGPISLDIKEIQGELIEKILSTKNLIPQDKREKTPRKGKTLPRDLDKEVKKENWEAIVIGASTGGPKALSEIINNLPRLQTSIPIFIVQHMPKGFTASFAERLNNQCSLTVKEAEAGELIKKGHIYIAPGDYHMTFQGKHIALDKRDKYLGVRPCVDYLFQSAAKVYGDKLLGFILTGMGKDGSKGMQEIKAKGGVNIAQDKESSVVFGMPGSAISAGVIDQILSLEEIGNQLNEILKG